MMEWRRFVTYLWNDPRIITVISYVFNVVCDVVYQTGGSDKENHVVDKQADKSLLPNMSASLTAAVTSSGVVPLPSSSLSSVTDAGVPVTSSRCTPVIGSTSLLNGASGGGGGGASDFLSGIARCEHLFYKTVL